MASAGVIRLETVDMAVISRSLAVIALFSERFDALVDSGQTADDSALRVAGSVLNLLKPFVAIEIAPHLEELTTHYDV
jgi:hypothetical protein